MNAIKKIGLGIISGCVLISADAQTIKDTFVSFPESMLAPLNTNNRLDLIDMHLAGQEAVVKNALGNDVFLRNFTEDYLYIQSGNLTVELFFLTLVNESKLIGVIQTVCAPVCDSRLEFYTLNWKKLDTESFISLVDKFWFLEENQDFTALDISLMEFHYDAEKQLLSQTYNTPSYLNREDKEKTDLFIRKKNKEYEWNGIRFK
jgi:hypothetical protein